MRPKLLLLFLFFASYAFAQSKNQSIGFKENKGQIIDQKGKPNPEVKYLLNTSGLNVQIKTNGFSYDIYETKKHPLTEKQKAKLRPSLHPETEKEKLPDYTLEYIYHRIDIDFVNSNPKVELITEQKSKDYDNYYNIPNKPEGVLMVHQYQQITYKNIYPNIDVVFSIPEDSLKAVEYNFVVHPKGKISDIQMQFNGAKTELVDNKIRMQVRFGAMEETLPMSWTEDGKNKKEIAIGYTKIKKNVYGFASAENVSGKTVVIDPVPTRLWGTYYGEGNSVTFGDVDCDANGNTYLVGYTSMENSFGFYATSGAHQAAGLKEYDGVIAKFDSNGKRIWGTYYGGESYDYINSIIVDKQNDFIITGSTESTTNISTIGSYKENSSGGNKVFLAKFNSLGIRTWATYFGGDYGVVEATDIDIDSSNNIYIVGITDSKLGISINNSFQTLLNHVQYNNSSYDGFLTKFNSNGNLIWSTYVGGENHDYINTIKVGIDHLVLGGMTYSKNYISTPNTFQTNNFNNWIDGTVYKFNLNGDRIWSTYYGGEGLDELTSIELDDQDNIYMGGYTNSKNNIATPGSFDEINNLGSTGKGFIVKLNKDGQRIWGSYFGEATILYSIIFKNNFLYLGGMGNDPVWGGIKIYNNSLYI